MKKVLITGCSGFIGDALITECLKCDWYVVGVDRRPIPRQHSIPSQFIQSDVRDLGFRDLMGVDMVFHLAWRTNIPDCQRHPVESTRDNIDMSIHILELAREAGVKKFFFPSTASLYGHNPTPWKEDMPAIPIEPYSWQKLAIEYACQMYAKVYGLPTVICRFFQVFGDLQRSDTALAAFLRAKEEGRPITLTETTAQSTFRSGQRDFVHASDVARAVIVCTDSEETGAGEIFNVASGKVHAMEEVAEAIGGEVKWIERRSYEVERHEANIDKLLDMGWKPKVDVIEWLKRARRLC